jgi:hypothetical protein
VRATARVASMAPALAHRSRSVRWVTVGDASDRTEDLWATLDPPRVVHGDLLELLLGLASEGAARRDAVVFHTSVLCYVASEGCERFRAF